MVEVPGRGELWWSEARRVIAGLRVRRAAAVGLVVLAVSAVGWFVVGSSGPRDAAAVAPSPVSARPPDAVDRAESTPVSREGWRVLVDRLYQQRAEAFSTSSPDLLEDVYAPGSDLLAADVAYASSLADAGEALRGFDPAVEQVTAARTEGDRAEVDLVDSWADSEVVAAGQPDGPALRTVPGRPSSAVHMVLVRSDGGWLIESAERRA